MKHFVVFCFFFLLCYNMAEAQTPTFAGLPEPQNVLVVYNSLDQTSIDVKDYYKLRRGIPDINIVRLSLPSDTMITYDGVTHSIELAQQGEIIKDMDNEFILTPTIHAWLYFNERMA